jgi:hypothetical protein
MWESPHSVSLNSGGCKKHIHLNSAREVEPIWRLLKVKPKLIAKPVRPALVKPIVDFGLIGL